MMPSQKYSTQYSNGYLFYCIYISIVLIKQTLQCKHRRLL